MGINDCAGISAEGATGEVAAGALSTLLQQFVQHNQRRTRDLLRTLHNLGITHTKMIEGFEALKELQFSLPMQLVQWVCKYKQCSQAKVIVSHHVI
jgi:hypothetical protein